MARQFSPDEIEKLKAFSHKFHGVQQKLAAKRAQFRELFADTDARLRLLPSDSVGGQYLRLQRRLLELSLANLDTWQLDAAQAGPIPGVMAPAQEARGLELKLTGLRMDLLAMGELAKLAQSALAAEPDQVPVVPAGAPEAWAEQAEAIATDKDRRALWDRYLSDVQAFQSAADLAVTALEEMAPAENAAARVKQLRSIKIPSLNGLDYRVNTALKGIAGGEALLKAVRERIVPAAAAGVGAKGKPRKPVTDRLFDLFKPPS